MAQPRRARHRVGDGGELVGSREPSREEGVDGRAVIDHAVRAGQVDHSHAARVGRAALGLRGIERGGSGGHLGLRRLVAVDDDLEPEVLRPHEPETVAAMTLATQAIVDLGLPTGVQVIAAAKREALAIAHATGAEFIRVEGFAYAHVADEGWIDASAGPLLRARSALASEVEIWADIQKKHSAHAVTADMSIDEWVHGATFCGADGVIITGSRTGSAPGVDDVRKAAEHQCMVVVGSGVNAENIAAYADTADAVIVGSSLKVGGDWRNAVDTERVGALRRALDRCG